jgi:hypothetical protein
MLMAEKSWKKLDVLRRLSEGRLSVKQASEILGG